MGHVCPWWIGYILLSPLRRLVEDPERLIGDLVKGGMTVLEPGCGMGYLTLPLARMVGPEGRVVVVDVQEKMLDALARRARRAGLVDRIDRRLSDGVSLGLGDLAGTIDFAVALHVVHEVPDQARFFTEIHDALKPGGRLLFREPKGHVSAEAFEASLAAAREAGFEAIELGGRFGPRGGVLARA
jgi:ubiquinone/menaquinone biosynthesis C-methylase UbiE